MLEGGERFFADVVLDPFGVGLGDVRPKTERREKSHDDLMAAADLLGELTAPGRQEDRAIRLGGDHAEPPQPRDRLDDGHVRDAQSPCDVGGAGLAGRVDQIGDDLDIILGDLGEICAARAPVNFGLLFSRDQRPKRRPRTRRSAGSTLFHRFRHKAFSESRYILIIYCRGYK